MLLTAHSYAVSGCSWSGGGNGASWLVDGRGEKWDSGNGAYIE